jgi:hypothetical protein
MAKLKQLDNNIKEFEHALDRAYQSHIDDYINEVLSKLSKLREQKAIILKKLEEKGKIGYFRESEPQIIVQERRKRSAVQVGEIFQLPSVGQDRLICPNVIIRSSLFGLRSSQVAPEILDNTEMASEEGASILFTGPRLCQLDMLVWTTILRKVADDISQTFSMTTYSLLKELGLPDGATSYSSIAASLQRLNAAKVTIRPKHGETPVTNCRMLIYTHEGNTAVFSFEPQWAYLFSQARWSRIEKNKITGLKRKELARWLAWFLQSHDGKVDIPVTKLHVLSGSTSSLKGFRQTLNEAIRDCASHGIVLRGGISDVTDCVKFQKK